MMITFSKFAKILYTHCGKDNTQADFVTELALHIIGGQPTRGYIDKKGVERYVNPLKIEDKRYLNKIFSGKRSLPANKAREILGRIDKAKFEKFIQDFSDQARLNVAEELTSAGISSVNHSNVDEKCADIFEAILIERAKR